MRKSLLLLSALALPVAISAQSMRDGDVTFPASDQLPNYVEQWRGGGGKLIVNGEEWEDEAFFVSRVKPRKRVTSTGTNIYDFGTKAGRRAMWWVPIDGPGCQGIPSGRFNGEAFSMWSYLDIYGVFTAPYGWVTGAFADACHKNGVATGGQASMPWNGFAGSNWETCMTAMANKYSSDEGVQALGKFMHYHGVDGLGYNSESSGWASIIANIRKMHNGLAVYMKDRNPIWENIWYDGTNDNGTLDFDSFLSRKTQLYAGSSIFSNYNWNNESRMASAVSLANGVTDPNGNARGPWWNYAGMNQQGGEPKTGETYPYLKKYDWSMGWWGAHSYNMFWEGRGSHGTTDDAVMNGYLRECERFFGNGPRNPAIKKEITTVRSHRANDEFFGVSAFINERSALTHALGTDPFYTFFNLGNGKFFNWKGERVSDNGWTSIAIQDFLPTWRFWTAPTWLQKTVTEGTTNLNVGFTYEDAYFGGSCLKIEGTTAKEYLHLFKTEMSGFGTKTITLRYKVLGGTGDMRLVMTSVNNPGTEPTNATLKNMKVFTAAQCPDIENDSYRDGAAGWQEYTVKVTATMGNNNSMPGGLGCIGLEFTNADQLTVLLGELSILPNSNTATPAAPQILSSKVLRNVSTGVDGKIFWTMDNNVAAMSGTPKYNSDVNTSMFKIYSREEGSSEAKFLGATTTWAALAFRAPNTDDSKKIQFGVSAVSMDTRTESAISWGALLEKGEYEVSEEFKISKLTIKPNEAFKVYFADSKHEPVQWKIVNQEGTVMAENFGLEIDLPAGLPEWGGYDLYIGDKLYAFYIQISEEKVGALPEIYTIANESGTVESTDAPVNIQLSEKPILSYTGRKADGSASRGVDLNSTYFGTKVGDVGIQGGESFTVATWVRIKKMPASTYLLMNISDKGDGWPINTWGWVWSNGLPSGKLFTTFRGNKNGSASPGELHYTYPNTYIQPGVWTHMAWVQEYDPNLGFRHFLYVNGVKQESKVFSYLVGGEPSSGYRQTGDYDLSWHNDENGQREGDNDGDIWIDNQTHPISASDWIYFGGQAHQGSVADGAIDDFQIWNKALSAAEVKTAMAGFPVTGDLPDGLATYWDFEGETTDNCFLSRGTVANVKSCSYELEHEGGNPEAPSVYVPKAPVFDQGCPFLEGTAYPVVTEAKWKDSLDRRTAFARQGEGAQDQAGTVQVGFLKEGDHTITLTLENTFGADSRTFPVYQVGNTAIDGINADAEGLKTYTVDRTLFLQLAEDGDYQVLVYNAAGMMLANKQLTAAAGQTATIDLGSTGIYLVKVIKGGKELRSLKVASK